MRDQSRVPTCKCLSNHGRGQPQWPGDRPPREMIVNLGISVGVGKWAEMERCPSHGCVGQVAWAVGVAGRRARAGGVWLSRVDFKGADAALKTTFFSRSSHVQHDPPRPAAKTRSAPQSQYLRKHEAPRADVSDGRRRRTGTWRWSSPASFVRTIRRGCRRCSACRPVRHRSACIGS